MKCVHCLITLEKNVERSIVDKIRKDDKMPEIKDEIILRGLKEHNLKNVNLNIPKEKIIVFTGLSGSGKSSVAFDTLATESRRQMTLNYPHYVRYQMPRYERPHA